jgi:DNA-binding MarR family transcriptional regulator
MAADTAGARLEQRWRGILAVHSRTVCEIDRVLHPYGLCASDFEVLEVLVSGAPDGPGVPCRVQDIAERVHLSQSALSRLLGRLEREGLLERTVCREDRRGVWVSPTPRGRELYALVRPLQREVLSRTLTD